MNSEMYKENILDHYKHPRNFGILEGATKHARAVNPLCGDEMEFFLQLDGDNKIAKAEFQGRGCTISMASGSMLTENLVGKTVTDVQAMTPNDMVQLLGVPINPARLKCATLALEAAQQALQLTS